jgi:hypothetical protein
MHRDSPVFQNRQLRRLYCANIMNSSATHHAIEIARNQVSRVIGPKLRPPVETASSQFRMRPRSYATTCVFTISISKQGSGQRFRAGTTGILWSMSIEATPR